MTSTNTAAANAAQTSESVDPVSAPKPSRKRLKAFSEADEKPTKPTSSAGNKRARHTAPANVSAVGDASDAVLQQPRQTKTSIVEALLTREGGASLEALCGATGWQTHTCRAFLTGLRKKGREVMRSSDKDGKSIYLIAAGHSPALSRTDQQVETEGN
jgi:hypothetical protein